MEEEREEADEEEEGKVRRKGREGRGGGERGRRRDPETRRSEFCGWEDSCLLVHKALKVTGHGVAMGCPDFEF